jgi:hypothetical protein
MKKLLSFILSLTLALSLCAVSACAGSNDGGGQGVKLISGNDLVSNEPFVKWEGRYSFTESDGDLPAKVNLYHSATGFTIEFTGTELYVTFESEISGGKSSREPYYNVAVDNEVIPTVSPERTFKKVDVPAPFAPMIP